MAFKTESHFLLENYTNDISKPSKPPKPKSSLHIKPKMHHIPILHNIFLSLNS